MNPAYLYKVISDEKWKKSQTREEVILSSMDTDFIHLATEEQLDHVIRKFWGDTRLFVVLKIDAGKLRGSLRLETNPGGTTKYYHLYVGGIPLTAIQETITLDNRKKCACHSQLPYGICCGLHHQGVPVSNALALMRSRYSAYVLKLADYIMDTTHPKNPYYLEDRALWKEQILSFCKETFFEDLKIYSFEDGVSEAFVTFTAIIRQGKHDASFTEKSRFQKVANRWLYLDGDIE